MFKNRSTTDIIVILFTVMIGVSMVITLIGILFLKVKYPSIDTSKAGELLGNIATTIVGALVGFIGGRAMGRAEANGNGKANGHG